MNHTNAPISNNKRLIVVLGMHRSGTSAITRGLCTMGINLGDNIIPPQQDNIKGFWEDSDILSLNNEILETINKEWHYLASITQKENEIIYQKGYFNRAVNLLRQKTEDFAIFGLKDPRITILLPFWKDVFAFLNFDVSYILAVRHPISVAKSLENRDNFDIEKSHLMWLTYVINGLYDTNTCERIIVDYDNLIQDPERELKRIADTFYLNINIKALEIYNSEFLDNNLRHTSYTFDDLIQHNITSKFLKDVYSTVIELSISKEIDNQFISEKTDKWKSELSNLNEALTLSDKLYKRISFLSLKIQENNKLIENQNQELSIQSENIISKNFELSQKDKELNQIVKSKSWRITKPLRFLLSFFK